MKNSYLVASVAGIATLLGAGFAKAQDLYVTDGSPGSDSITYYAPGSTTGSTLSSSLLSDPTGIAYDNVSGSADQGDVFVANASGSIVTYDPATNTFSDFASGLTNPEGLAFDTAGNLYVADDATSNDGGGVMEYVGGVASGAKSYASPLSNPAGIAIDGFGDLYVTVGGNMLARIAPGGGAGSTSLVSIPSPNGLNNPVGITFNTTGTALYVVNSGAPNVEQVTFFLTGSTSVSGSTLTGPVGDIFDANGNLYVADSGSNEVTEYSLEPGSNGVYTLEGTLTSNLSGPSFLAFAPAPDIGSVVPEPSTYAMLLCGAVGLYFFQRRRVAAMAKI